MFVLRGIDDSSTGFEALKPAYENGRRRQMSPSIHGASAGRQLG